jgi:hypothetical protein
MPWTKQHHNFCLKQNMWAATINLCCFIYSKCKPNESTEMEVDVDQFAKYMKKTSGKSYHRTYFPKLMRQLDENSNGGVVILRYYGHGIYKILVRPISFAIENGKLKPEVALGQATGNPMFSEEHKQKALEQQQQDIEQIENLFNKIGMKWSRAALLKIWRKAGKNLNEVKDAMDFMLYANTTQEEPIRKPHAWFIRAMERGDYKLFAHQLEYQLPRFKSGTELMSYITCHLYGDPSPIPSQ